MCVVKQLSLASKPRGEVVVVVLVVVAVLVECAPPQVVKARDCAAEGGRIVKQRLAEKASL